MKKNPNATFFYVRFFYDDGGDPLRFKVSDDFSSLLNKKPSCSIDIMRNDAEGFVEKLQAFKKALVVADGRRANHKAPTREKRKGKKAIPAFLLNKLS